MRGDFLRVLRIWGEILSTECHLISKYLCCLFEEEDMSLYSRKAQSGYLLGNFLFYAIQ